MSDKKDVPQLDDKQKALIIQELLIAKNAEKEGLVDVLDAFESDVPPLSAAQREYAWHLELRVLELESIINVLKAQIGN